GQVRLGLLDPGHVSEGHLALRVRRVELGPAPPEAAQDSAGAGAAGSTAEIDEGGDQQDGGAEAQEEAGEPAPGAYGGRRDGHSLAGQLVDQVVLGEGRAFGLEGRPAGRAV